MSYCALQKQSAAEQLPSLDSSWAETSDGRRQEPYSSWTPFNNMVVPISTPCCSSAACQSQYVGCQPEGCWLRADRNSGLQELVSSSSQRPFILPSLPTRQGFVTAFQGKHMLLLCFPYLFVYLIRTFPCLIYHSYNLSRIEMLFISLIWTVSETTLL